METPGGGIGWPLPGMGPPEWSSVSLVWCESPLEAWGKGLGESIVQAKNLV